jgi:hypothetical protein
MNKSANFRTNRNPYKKSPSASAKGLEIVRLPLLETLRTFKGDIVIENIRLNQLILQY